MSPWSYSRVMSRAWSGWGLYCSRLSVSVCVCVFSKCLYVCVCVCFRQLWRKPFPVWRWRSLLGLGGRRPRRHAVSLQFHRKALPLFCPSLPLSCSACHPTNPHTSIFPCCLLPCRCSWSMAQRRRKCRPENNSRPHLLFIHLFFLLSMCLTAYFGGGGRHQFVHFCDHIGL